MRFAEQIFYFLILPGEQNAAILFRYYLTLYIYLAMHIYQEPQL